AWHRESLAPECAKLRRSALQFSLVAREERDATAFGHNLPRDGEAEAARAAGNENRFSGEGKIAAHEARDGPGRQTDAAEDKKNRTLHAGIVTAKAQWCDGASRATPGSAAKHPLPRPRAPESCRSTVYENQG